MLFSDSEILKFEFLLFFLNKFRHVVFMSVQEMFTGEYEVQRGFSHEWFCKVQFLITVSQNYLVCPL
jgi:hypothetical protein